MLRITKVFLFCLLISSSISIRNFNHEVKSKLNSVQLLDCTSCVLNFKVFAIYPFGNFSFLRSGCFTRRELASNNSPYVTIFYAETPTNCLANFIPKIFFNSPIEEVEGIWFFLNKSVSFK